MTSSSSYGSRSGPPASGDPTAGVGLVTVFVIFAFFAVKWVRRAELELGVPESESQPFDRLRALNGKLAPTSVDPISVLSSASVSSVTSLDVASGSPASVWPGSTPPATG